MEIKLVKSTFLLILSSLVLVYGQRVQTSYPFPFYCNKFYQCYEGLTYEVLCPTGMLFDSRDLICATNTSTTCYQGWGIVNNPCPNQTTVQIPYPDDCRRYYACTNDGFAYIYECPGGRYYNSNRRLCDAPETSGCTQPGTPLPQTTVYPNATGTPSTGCNDNTSLNFTCSSNGNFPYPNSSNIYFYCNIEQFQNQPRIAVCPSGQSFNRPTSSCAATNTTGCAQDMNILPNPCNGEFNRLADKTECRRYFYCQDSRAQYFSELISCIPPNLFDNITRSCLDPAQQNVVCDK